MLVVIEGLDGSGKSTQLQLLQEHLRQRQMAYEYLHFPRLDTPLWGNLISRFLRGEFGDNHQVNPYLVALLYALDRNDARSLLQSWLEAGKLVVLDRYVNSNIAYQCAKFSSPEKQRELEQWILSLEYGYYRLPRPDLNIFLDVPVAFVRQQLTRQRQGSDRSYLKGNTDIHEADISFQEKVREMYLHLAHSDSSMKVISCAREDGSMLEPVKIFEKIKELLNIN